jgi:O-phospho-L-seryl-tRNASec:L-selenocysteinyl-tRNA synthase
MLTANLQPVIIEPLLDSNNELTTDLEEVEKQINILGPENVLCIFSTTSCFAPRGYDKIIEISKICKKHNIFHLINNAYGIYCTKIVDMLNQSVKAGNVDIIVSSTDKNFMVPVGGSLIYSPTSQIIEKIKNNYPGRASLSPLMDLFITLLEMGKNKFKFLIQDRKKKYVVFKEEMKKIAQELDEKIIENPNNKISLCMSLVNICKNATNKKDITYFGSLFFKRQISGIKIIAPSPALKWNGYDFNNYGSHCQEYQILPYCAFACAIGITDEEVKLFYNIIL